MTDEQEQSVYAEVKELDFFGTTEDLMRETIKDGGTVSITLTGYNFRDGNKEEKEENNE